MMNMLEEAIIYATIMHQGKVRKFGGQPFILHPMEVAHILSTMTDDQEIITAGILHDIVEDTDGTLEEIEARFGKRVAALVSSETEEGHEKGSEKLSWKQRKEGSILVLVNTNDIAVKMLWLADKLSNIRSLAGNYSEHGEAIWQELHQKDPAMHCWYYRSIAENIELSLNKTGAFKEFIKHINFIWPGTFNSDKSRYKKYREVSVDGCKLLGRGAKGDVYRYNDELVIKVYNDNNTYIDVEREIALSRRAFILGLPTAISFGIVSVGKRYGAMFELVDSETMSKCISRNPGQAAFYAGIMADLARTIHSIKVSEDDVFPDALDRIRSYISPGIDKEAPGLAERFTKLLDAFPCTDTLIHGDFHTGNVFLQNGEPLLIDLDRISRGDPIVEISDMIYFYRILGEDDPSVIEKFMGFSIEISHEFFDQFLKKYLGTDDPVRIRETEEKALLIGYVRYIRKLCASGDDSADNRKRIDRYVAKTEELLDRVDSLKLGQ